MQFVLLKFNWIIWQNKLLTYILIRVVEIKYFWEQGQDQRERQQINDQWNENNCGLLHFGSVRVSNFRFFWIK